MNTTEFDPVGAWNTWCDNFLKAKTEPMTKEQSVAFFNVFRMEQGNTPIPAEIEKELFYAVATKRKEVLGLTINPYAILIFCVMSKSVGDVVMYLTAMTKRFHDTGQAITITEVTQAFPFGFPTLEERHRLWDEQKGFHLGQKFDNLVDRVFKESF